MHQAGREVYQSERWKGHAPLDRVDRQQSKDRRAVDRRTSRFPSISEARKLNRDDRGFGGRMARLFVSAAIERLRCIRAGGANLLQHLQLRILCHRHHGQPGPTRGAHRGFSSPPSRRAAFHVLLFEAMIENMLDCSTKQGGDRRPLRPV
jgi:hypothetical protein